MRVDTTGDGMKDSTAYDTTGDGKLNAFVSRTTTGSLEDWKIASGGRADRTRLATGRSTRTSRACRLRRCMRGRRRSRVSSARRSSRYGTQPAPCFVRSLDPITTSRPDLPACFVRWSLHPISPPQQLPPERGVVGLMALMDVRGQSQAKERLSKMRDERNEKILDKKRMDERLSKYATSDTHLPPTGSQPEPLEEPQYPLMVVSGLFESERRHLEHVDPRAHPRTPTRSLDR